MWASLALRAFPPRAMFATRRGAPRGFVARGSTPKRILPKEAGSEPSFGRPCGRLTVSLRVAPARHRTGSVARLPFC